MPRFDPDTYDAHDDSSVITLDEAARYPHHLVLRVNPGQCLCGCGETPKGSKSLFAMGHDARLKGKLIRAHLTGTPVTVITSREAQTKDAVEAASEIGWDAYLREAEARQGMRLSDRVDAANKGVFTRAMATRESEDEGTLAPGDRRLIRVGRWDYTGQVLAVYEADGEVEYEYVTKSGETKIVRKPMEEEA